MMTMKNEIAEEEDDVVVKYALTQLNKLLQLNLNDEDVHNQTLGSILDEKAKLVLKRLLDCATEHAVKSHAEVPAERAAFSMDQIISQRHLTSKEVPTLPCTSSNKIWNLPNSLEDLNCGSITHSNRLCQMHEKNSNERLNSWKEATSFHEKSLNNNDTAVKHFCSIMGSPSDATNSQALWFSSQPEGNHSDHVEENVFDTTLEESDCSLAKATKPLDHQMLSQTIVDPVKEKKWAGMHQKSHLPRNKTLSQSNCQKSDRTREDSLPTRILSQTKAVDQKQWIRDGAMYQKSDRTREDSLPTRMLSQTKAMDQRRSTGTALTTTLGPTLLRTASARLHFQKDHLNQVDENHKPRGSDQRSFHIGNKKLTSKGQFRQIISLPTLPVEKQYRKNARPSQDSHRKRIGDEKNAHLASPIGHLPSISTSASTWTGASTSPTDSVSRQTMTRQRVNPTSSEGSIKPSRRMSHYSMVAPPLHAGPTAHMKNTKKQTGRLQRLKNKLGLIFHHHHHHHHHHHNDGVSHTALSNPSHSFWKSLRNMLHRTSKDGQRKNRRHQQEAEHGIIDGLVRHVWRSKKNSKQSGAVKRLRKMHSKKVVKKWHWWRRGVVRQSSIRKPNVRWEFKGRKPQLRALTLKHH